MGKLIMAIWTFLTYCLVAGLAWFWVLGIQYSVWRLFGIAFLQTLCFVFQWFLIDELNKKVEAKK
jgi:hypothetical protein